MMELKSEETTDARRVVSADEMVEAYAEFNKLLIEQGIELLSQLPEDVYATPVPSLSNSTAGGHFRHCIEFYDALVGGVRSSVIDYDSRPRDERVERDLDVAIARLRSLSERLTEIEKTGDRTLHVRITAHDGRCSDVATSLARELEAAASHTIHHYAIIAVLARANGVEVDRSFGLALSTQRFLAGQKAEGQ